MRILELGSYIAPAYAGLILAEQGHEVVKLASKNDPILTLIGGEELWQWINQGKTIVYQSIEDINLDEFDAAIDNIREDTWRDRIANDPAEIARNHNLKWASLRSETGAPMFDILAQAQAWGDKGRLPFYIGDTAAGLWLAFKLLNTENGRHSIVYQSTCLAKLVEGNLFAQWRLWDEQGTYYTDENGDAIVSFKGCVYREHPRNDEWRAHNLKTDEHGNYIV